MFVRGGEGNRHILHTHTHKHIRTMSPFPASFIKPSERGGGDTTNSLHPYNTVPRAPPPAARRKGLSPLSPLTLLLRHHIGSECGMEEGGSVCVCTRVGLLASLLLHTYTHTNTYTSGKGADKDRVTTYGIIACHTTIYVGTYIHIPRLQSACS